VVGSGKLILTNNENNDSPTSTSNKKEGEFVDLSSFARNNIMSAGWDKEIFPGMRCIIEKSSGKELSNDFIAHIFQAKKNVLMGATKKEDIYFGHNHLKEIMKPYTKNSTNNSDQDLSKIAKTIFKNNSNIRIISAGEEKKLGNGTKALLGLSKYESIEEKEDEDEDSILDFLEKQFDFLSQ
jgi:prenyltransferase beta subunit